MKWSLHINIKGVVENGLAGGKTDHTDWDIIEYIAWWLGAKKSKKKTIDVDGDEYIWIKYKQLMSSLPLVNITSKQALSARISKLRTLGLIKTQRPEPHFLYVTLTDLARNVTEFDPKAVQVNFNDPVQDNFNDPYKSTLTPYNTLTNNTIIKKEVSKDTIIESKLSTPVCKNSFCTKAIAFWNEIIFVQKIRIASRTKTIIKIEKYFAQLRNGKFLRGKEWDKKWLEKNGIPLDVKLTKKQILKGLQNVSLFFKEGYFPTDKSKLNKSLVNLLYNDFSRKSLFLLAFYNPPKPKQTNDSMKDDYPEATKCVIKQMNGTYDKNSVGDKRKIIEGIKEIAQFRSRIPKESLKIHTIHNEFGSVEVLCKHFMYWMGCQGWIEITPYTITTKGKIWTEFIKTNEKAYDGYKLS